MKANLSRLSKSFRVLISDEVHPILIEGLSNAGHTCLYKPKASREEIAGILPEADAWVLRTGVQADADLLSKGRSLIWIGRAGVGLDNIDVATAKEMGITCENAGEANAIAVAEHALGLLLMQLHHLGKAFLEVRQGIWLREENRGSELSGKTIGIIGYGNTGSAFAKVLIGLGVNIMVYDKYKSGFGSSQVKECSLLELQQMSDIISFHVPLTHETTWMLNDAFLAQCSKKIHVLNLSRGKVVNSESLVGGIKSGKVISAALDVLENESLDRLSAEEKSWFDFLKSAPNVVLTPHIGGWTKESYLKISEVLLNKFLTFSANIKEK